MNVLTIFGDLEGETKRLCASIEYITGMVRIREGISWEQNVTQGVLLHQSQRKWRWIHMHLLQNLHGMRCEVDSAVCEERDDDL
jgi:hypothetical protein